ncbi:archaellin/type IV pilin N-terminal domain-containing protein [Pyrodictium abyssi]|uniref:Flagellin n=1 Tax=Pyrodictium abyssi TaxID=54256 RepID=A0ABM8ITP0_9CREN|nr:flagellin [Pyrodictium abyssi]
MRAIVGIEAAIVLIAFVLVASALAFVAINMGMFASQKSKEVMAKAYDSATRALDVAGNAIAEVQTISGERQATMIFLPVKLTAGTNPIDLDKTVVSLLVQKPNGTSIANANIVQRDANGNIYITNTTNLTAVNNVQAYKAIWIAAQGNNNTLLEPGEVMLLAVNVTDTNGLPPYSKVQIEIKPPVGAPLVVRYEIPPVLTSDFVDLIVGG